MCTFEAFINEGKLTNIEEIAGHPPQSKHVNTGGVSCITSGHIHRPEFQWRGESPKMRTTSLPTTPITKKLTQLRTVGPNKKVGTSMQVDFRKENILDPSKLREEITP